MGEKTKEELRQLRLQAVLTEYQALRSELLQRFNHHLQIYSIIITAMTLMFGWIIAQKQYDVLLIIPILTSALALRYIWDQNLIVMLGKYINKLEKDVFPYLLCTKDDDNLPVKRIINWEHYYQKKSPKFGLYKFAILILMILIPILPALTFSILNLLPYIMNSNDVVISNLHPSIHLIAAILYLITGIYLSRKLWKS